MFHLHLGIADAARGDAHVLQQERGECHATGDVLELQVHQLVVQLHALDVQSARGRTGESDDVERHAAEVPRQVTHHELRTALGVERRPDRDHGARDQQPDHEDRYEQERPAQYECLDHSFGEKLMCSRGPCGAQLEPPNGAWQGS